MSSYGYGSCGYYCRDCYDLLQLYTTRAFTGPVDALHLIKYSLQYQTISLLSNLLSINTRHHRLHCNYDEADQCNCGSCSNFNMNNSSQVIRHFLHITPIKPVKPLTLPVRWYLYSSAIEMMENSCLHHRLWNLFHLTMATRLRHSFNYSKKKKKDQRRCGGKKKPNVYT